jgi:hypothetical protein
MSGDTVGPAFTAPRSGFASHGGDEWVIRNLGRSNGENSARRDDAQLVDVHDE